VKGVKQEMFPPSCGHEPAAGATDCSDCALRVKLSENTMGQLVRCSGLRTFSSDAYLPVVGFERAFAAAAAAAAAAAPAAAVASCPLRELRHLRLRVLLDEVRRLVAIFKDSAIEELNLTLFLHHQRSIPHSALPTPPSPTTNPLSPLAAFADMIRLRGLSLMLNYWNAQLLALDMLALRTLPCGLRKLVMESGFLGEPPSMTNDDVLAVASRLPYLEDLRVFFPAPPITADLLPKIGSSCQRLVVLFLPLRYNAAAVERGQRASAAADVPV
jgi:hypothetical protein